MCKYIVHDIAFIETILNETRIDTYMDSINVYFFTLYIYKIICNRNISYYLL